jgi:hypothetical protein
VPEARPARLGDLLTQAKVLRKEDLADAIQIATDTGQLIGKVLVMSDYLSRHNLQVVIDAQSMIRDQLLDYDFGIEAIKFAVKEQITLDEGLKRLAWTPKTVRETARLGELLTDANLITNQQLEAGLSLAQESGQPLGSCLIAMKYLPDRLVLFALDQQSAVREGQVTKEQAIKNIAAQARKTAP